MVIPCVPKYTTLPSVLCAWKRSGHASSVSILEPPPIQAPGHRHVFGWAAGMLSQRAFNGHLSADEIVRHHSQLPLFDAWLPEQLQVRRRTDIIKSSLSMYRSIDAFAAHDCIESPTMRRCPKCVDEDLQRYRFGHWRLFHQWPFARHCAAHRMQLQDVCTRCHCGAVPVAFPGNMAHDACKHCGSRLFDAMDVADLPAPYWSLLDLCFRALRGQAPELSAEKMTGVWEDLAKRGISQQAVLTKTFIGWGCSSMEELARILRIDIDRARAMKYPEATSTIPLMCRLAVLNAALSEAAR